MSRDLRAYRALLELRVLAEDKANAAVARALGAKHRAETTFTSLGAQLDALERLMVPLPGSFLDVRMHLRHVEQRMRLAEAQQQAAVSVAEAIDQVAAARKALAIQIRRRVAAETLVHGEQSAVRVKRALTTTHLLDDLVARKARSARR